MFSEIDSSGQARVTKVGKTGKERQPFLYGTNEKGLRSISDLEPSAINYDKLSGLNFRHHLLTTVNKDSNKSSSSDQIEQQDTMRPKQHHTQHATDQT